MKQLKTTFSIFLFLFINISLSAQETAKVDNDQEFIDFLAYKLENEVVNNETVKEFNERSWAYWHEHKLDYNLNPQKYKKAIGLYYQNKLKFKINNTKDANRYSDAIEKFHRFDTRNSLAINPILFIGSSSIAGWETSISFPEFPIINRGIGGISMSEIIQFYDVLFKKYAPSILIVYCDIDIESGKSPSDAVASFKILVDKVKIDFPNTHVLLMSMKPTLIDDFIGNDIRKNKMRTNKDLLAYCKLDKNTHFVDVTQPMFNANGSLRSDIFLSDGMHLNMLGYELWNPIVREQIISLKK